MKSISKIYLVIFMLAGVIHAQELPQFEKADNVSLGLIPVLVDRWGCSSADIDRNGYPDIFSNKWRGHLESQIYLNDNGYFADIYPNSPQLKTLEVDGNATRTPVLVDFDNDGDRDLWIGFDYSQAMFRNDDNVFINITNQLGITSGVPGFVSVYGYEMSAWIDWDNDGDLDGLVAQTNNANYIFYRNDGNAFVNIAASVGLANQNELGASGDRGYNTCRIQWIDWDNDGDPDLSAGWKLFRNDYGHLTEVSQSVGFLPYHDLVFCDWFDYDNDGDFDFILQGYNNHDEIWRNENGTFVDATQELGLDIFTKPNQACMNVADFDNDGDQDVFIQIDDDYGLDLETLLLNDEFEPGQRAFVDVGDYVGMTVTGDRKGSTTLDYDMDGKIDVFIPSVQYGSVVYHNLGTETPNNWIGFDLWGTKSNKDALGTLITVYTENNKQVRYTKAATTWKVQDNPFVHFGIGQATSVDSVVFYWPMGNVQVLKDVAINQYHKIVEPSGTSVAEKDIEQPKQVTLSQNYPNPFNPETTISYHLAEASAVHLVVYNNSGQKVATLIDGRQEAGQQTITWNATSDLAQPLPSGVYLYRLQANSLVLTKKMMLVR